MIVNQSNAKHYKWGADCDGWQFLFSEDLNVTYERMPAGTSEVRHYHRQSRQFFFGLSGIATLERDGKKHYIRPREGVEVPSFTPHQMVNETDEAIEFLVISHPNHTGDRELVTGSGERQRQ